MQRTKVENSAKVKAYAYDPDQRILEIEYQWGAVIQYLEVDQERAFRFEQAASKGSFLSREVEYQHDYKRIDTGKPDLYADDPEDDAAKDQRMFERDRARSRAGIDDPGFSGPRPHNRRVRNL